MRIFPELEDLLCFGCSANEGKYRTEDTIKVCKSFAKKIWKAKSDEDLYKPSTRFDGCGLLSEDNSFDSIEGADKGYIIPSKIFKSFEEFINALKIPYYEDYRIVVEDGNEDNCFNRNNFLKLSQIFIILLGFMALV